ncbi:Dual specificity protein phosphatase 12 [Giardia muris]|uniref:Dual specificity protein phosphatase 12 n=1 Tax=Giardia muris TaxID=5742 RepID=A0A4Z1ST31_GIAMU|nr:Dual specificity protein phosphatase 12 [Giardia muris]|eukprot:TNJ28910.1 Dual specificity protein phosphatase 12 [Giardia muris]
MSYVGLFRCGKCSTPLFLDEHLIEHETFAQVSFKNGQAPEKSCSSYFVKVMSWMGDLLGNKGNLHCPKCERRVGSYCWSGLPCTCGGLVIPYIAVHRNKVDRVLVEDTQEPSPTS